MSDKKAPEPMDAGAPERASSGEVIETRLRVCYAAKQLIQEVIDLFPETIHETNTENMRNVQLGIDFVADEEGLAELLQLVSVDSRVASVVTEEGLVKVGFHNRPRTYDLRDSFGLADAWLVLIEEDYAGSGDMEGGDASYTSNDVKDGGGA